MKLRRHQTLRAALDWSYGLLSDEERAVFRRAGVFAGGFTLELAQRVAQDERSDQWGVVDLLAQLIDKSLVIAEGEGEPRYRLLEPARAFALEQLAAAGESAPMLRRHAEALADVMEASDRAQWTEPFERRLAQRAELGNLRAALEWAISDRGDVELAYRLLGRSWFVWLANNVPLEGFGWMLRFWPVHEGLEPEIEAAFCLAMANLRPASPGDEVLQSACRAAELYRRLGDSSRLADALIRVAVSAMARKGTVATEEVLHEAARLVTDAAPLRQQAALAMVQGGWALEKSDYKGAIAAFRRQADCARRDGNTLGELLALSNVALGLLDDGKVDEAVDILNRCIAGMQRIQAPYGIANTRSLLAVALAVRGDTADVLALASDAFHHLSMVGASAFSRPLLAAALYHARRGDLRRASLVAGVALDALQKDTGHLCPIETRMKDQLLELAASAGIAERVLVWLRAGASLTPTQASGIAFADQPLDEECV